MTDESHARVHEDWTVACTSCGHTETADAFHAEGDIIAWGWTSPNNLVCPSCGTTGEISVVETDDEPCDHPVDDVDEVREVIARIDQRIVLGAYCACGDQVIVEAEVTDVEHDAKTQWGRP